MIQSGAEPVDVGRDRKMSATSVLLDRGVAGCEPLSHHAGFTGGKLARRSEIDQHDPAFIGDYYIFRFDVAMKYIVAVHLRESIGDPGYVADRFLPRELRLVRQGFAEGFFP